MSVFVMNACEWRVGPAGPDEIRIVERERRDHTVMYAVTQLRYVANRDLDWELEPIPSDRDQAFITRTRWADWGDAAEIAQAMARDGKRVKTCPRCDGEGEIQHNPRAPDPQFVESGPCPRCHSEGVVLA